MDDSTITIDLYNRQQAYAIIKERLYPFLGHWLQAGKQLVLTVSLKKRTPKQNKRYWGKGVLAQIAAQAVVGGKLYSAEVWHENFKQMFIGVDPLPLGGVRGQSSTQLNTAQFCNFSDQVEAYACTELGVVFHDLEPRE